MDSKLSKALRLKYPPVAVLWSDEKPEGATQFREGRWGCITFLLSAAVKGRVACADRASFGCPGGASGLGFGTMYDNFPGGIDYFLSTGNKEFGETEIGKKIFAENPRLAEGERYIKTPELARKFIDELPIREIPARYVVFKPLDAVEQDETPQLVIFFANADQISALVVMANYGRETGDNVIVPMGAGCHQTGIFPYREAESDRPRAVIGMTDISARKYLMKMMDPGVLSFTVPFSMFREMENNVEGSFLETEEWLKIVEYTGL